YLVLFNLLMSVDTWLLKRQIAEYYEAHHQLDVSDVDVGYYTKVQQVARLPYQAIIAVTFVVFPLLSQSTFAGDRDATRRYISVATRYSLVFAMVIAVVMAANPADVTALFYGAASAEKGGNALVFLALGNVAFSLFSIAGTILNAGKFAPLAIITAAIPLAL